MAKPKKKGEIEIPTHIMDDLCSRFVINNEKRLDNIQVFDAMENAHWHYIDFYCVQIKPPPPKCNHRTFSKLMLTYLTELSFPMENFEFYYLTWQEKKRTTPCFGGILLTPGYRHVLMVVGFGSKTAWSFPKGKKENLESGFACAVREIEEETGLNVTDRIREDRGIVQWVQDRFNKLYIIPDIPEDTPIQAKLRREIKSHRWIPVEALPTHKNDPAPQQVNLETSDFYSVHPFVRPLRKWIEEQIREKLQQQQQQQQQQKTLPASQFTAKGRRRGGKMKDVQRRQGAPGPDGDATTPTSASTMVQSQGQGRSNSRQSQVARNLEQQINDVSSSPQTWEDSGGSRKQNREDTMAGKGSSSQAGQVIHAGHHTLHLDQFHSKAMLHFKFDTQSILDIFRWKDN